jgi:site-specific DNA recombinase
MIIVTTISVRRFATSQDKFGPRRKEKHKRSASVKAAIYARYSTDKQDKTSIERQVRNCELLAKQHGLSVVDVFKDEGISGNDKTRPGYQMLKNALKAQTVAFVLADESSRLSRDPGELHNLVAEMEFNEQYLITRDGIDTREESADILIAVKTASDKLESRKIGSRTYGSLRERFEKGFSAGGRPYGYKLVAVDQYKQLEVDPATSHIIVRVFEGCAAGMGDRQIASMLNEDGIPSPGKSRNRNAKGVRTDGKWMHTTIRAILRNETYVGSLVWNKYLWRKKPGSSVRAKRIRPESEWIRVERPELRIVDQPVWAAVQARVADKSKKAAKQRANGRNAGGRPYSRLLSGMLKCAVCGYKYTLASRYDYSCASHRSGGDHACNNSLRVKRVLAESVILSAVKEKLLWEEMIEVAQRHMRSYIKSLKRQAAENNGDTNLLRRELATVDQQINNATAAIINGGLDKSNALAQTLKDLEIQKEKLLARLSSIALPGLDTLPDAMPMAVERYREEVGQLEQLGDRPKPEHVVRARAALRALLGEIWLQPNGDHLVAHVELQNQALALISGNVANSGSGGRI